MHHHNYLNQARLGKFKNKEWGSLAERHLFLNNMHKFNVQCLKNFWTFNKNNWIDFPLCIRTFLQIKSIVPPKWTVNFFWTGLFGRRSETSHLWVGRQEKDRLSLRFNNLINSAFVGGHSLKVWIMFWLLALQTGHRSEFLIPLPVRS